MAFAVGVSLSDIAVVFLMLTVLKNVDMEAALHNVYIASIGGAAIAAMGIYNFRKKAVAAADAKSKAAEARANAAIDDAVAEANRLGIKGKETTPFLLDKIKDITGGDSLASNIQLVLNNARLAAKVAALL